MEKENWNNFILKNNGSFLQSWEWGELKKGDGGKLVRMYEENNLAASLIYNPLILFKGYLYCPRGPVLSGDKSLSESLFDFVEGINNLPDKKNIVFVRIEPEIEESKENIAALHKFGFRESASIQPKETIFLDLRKEEEEILYSMDKDLRYAIRTAKKRKVVVEKLEEKGEKAEAFSIFWELFCKSNLRHGLRSYPKEYYEKLFDFNRADNQGRGCYSTIFVGKLGEKIISIAMVMFWGRAALYLYSASDSDYSKYNAPSLVLWEVIKEAKNKRSSYLDLWGVSSSKKRWVGVTKFKEKFGGERVFFVGTWDLVLNPRLYSGYEFFRSFFRK